MDNGDDLTARIAPEWVAFLEVPDWIEKQYGFRPPTEWMTELVTVVRTDARTVRHRVGDRDVSRIPKETAARWLRNGSGHPWFGLSDHPLRATVTSWDRPHFDSKTFTIAGHEQDDEPGERLAIEVHWDDVRKWLAYRIPSYQRQQRLDATRTTVDAKPPPKGRTSHAPVQQQQ